MPVQNGPLKPISQSGPAGPAQKTYTQAEYNELLDRIAANQTRQAQLNSKLKQVQQARASQAQQAL